MTPSHLLLVLSGAERAVSLARAAQQRGLTVSVAESGMHALTQLERGRPDLIVCDETLPDMRGADLLEIVRGDGDSADLPVVLLTSGPLPEVRGPLDRTLPPGLTPEALMAQVLSGAAGESSAGDTPDPSLLLDDLLLLDDEEEPQAPAPSAHPPSGQLGGTLDPEGFLDLLMFLSHTRRSGELAVRLGGDPAEARLGLVGGELWTASCGAARGEAAVGAVFGAVHQSGRAEFAFAPLPPTDLQAAPREITVPTAHLLLHTTVQFDEAHTSPPPEESHA